MKIICRFVFVVVFVFYSFLVNAGGCFDYQKLGSMPKLEFIEESEDEYNNLKRWLDVSMCSVNSADKDDPTILFYVPMESPPKEGGLVSDYHREPVKSFGRRKSSKKSSLTPKACVANEDYQYFGCLKKLYRRPKWVQDGDIYIFSVGFEQAMDAISPVLLIARLLFNPEIEYAFDMPLEDDSDALQFNVAAENIITWTHTVGGVKIQVEINRQSNDRGASPVKELIFTLCRLEDGRYTTKTYYLKDISKEDGEYKNYPFISEDLERPFAHKIGTVPKKK